MTDRPSSDERPEGVTVTFKGVSNEQLSLLLGQPVITVHCFFACPYVVRDFDPRAAHDLMERHYEEAHASDIDAWVGK